MTTLAVIGDVHGHLRHLEAVMMAVEARGVDGILLVGDLGIGLHNTNLHQPYRVARYTESLRQIIARVQRPGVPVGWVPGNHDLPEPDGGPGNVDFNASDVGGLLVAGIGGAGPARFGFPYEWHDDDIRARSFPACDVILSHTPPSDTRLDWVPGHQRHVGSAAVRELALGHTGFLVCGHIHESPGAQQLGACLCLNVGGLGHPFGRPQVGFIQRTARGDVAWHIDLTTGTRRDWARRT